MDIISPPDIVKNLLNRLETVYHDEVLKISYIDNNSSQTVIVFSHARYAPEDGREMLGGYTNSDRNILHVVDLKCSWFNNFTPEFVLSKIKNLIENKTLYLLGGSMGGFNAIIFSNYVSSKKCIVFGPQYSLIDELSPHFDLTRERISAIKNINIETLYFSPTTDYFLLFGNTKDERTIFLNIFKQCKKENISAKALIFHNAGHEILPYIAKNFDGAAKNIELIIDSNIYDIYNFYKTDNVTMVPSIKKYEMLLL